MRRNLLLSSLAVLSLALSACVESPSFVVTVVNDADHTRFLSGDESGPWFGMTELWYNGDRTIAFNEWQLCAASCGNPGIGVGCMDVARIPSVVALLPMDSTELEFSGDAWMLVPGLNSSCTKKTALSQQLTLELCHGSEAQTWEGWPLPEPLTSGLVSDEAVVVNPRCESWDFSLEDGLDIQVGLAAE